MKKLLSILMALSIVFVIAMTPVNARAESNSPISAGGISDFSYEFVSEGKLIYTYNRDGAIYKNVDTAIGDSIVNTVIYQKVEDDFIVFDTINYIIDGSSLIINSQKRGTFVSNEIRHYSSGGSWSFSYRVTGDINTDLSSVLAIATLLATAVSVPVAAITATARHIFEIACPHIYYEIDVYKDLDSNPHRPTFKKFITYYIDKEMETQIGDVVVHIWHSST